MEEHVDVVAAVKAALLARGEDLSGPCGAFKITSRVAWQLRAEGWGLIHSTGNGCETHGDKFRADTIMLRDGSVIDILNRSESDNGDTSNPANYNIPTWSPTGPQSPDNWRAPFDPGDVPTDAIDLRSADVFNSMSNIAEWPITGRIRSMEIHPSGSPNEGCSFQFDQAESWPNTRDGLPEGMGGIQYTVWPVAFINGRWVTSGVIQLWRGRPNTGSPPSKIGQDWCYDQRWGPLNGFFPPAGTQMGFFLSAGDARGIHSVTSVRERTAVVVINLPANDEGVFEFAGGPVPGPVPTPTPTPQPTPVDLGPLMQRVDALEERDRALQGELDSVKNELAAVKKTIPTGVKVAAQIPNGIPLIGGRSLSLSASLVLPS